ncbi:metal ABC transporter ATP-binding protein [Alkalicoccobacillus plakortidis]|uniref:Metal ABC transporter ATP-binding protein n=1 Tax=Alkalicoccobacillus plakortidis TaxID=444060 RepID=A0ABT0XPJ1_9BACI|nr:metal ABC transporter ATP-binding protein [Alkalicoccobacillus plakortidis]MCM2677824.1 metal ABC transporter ATP-binding protein [Alkalicoccobacillus plakortidis]
MTNQTILAEIKDVHFYYEDRHVLENVSLQLKKGSFLGLVGPNGSGKSTLIRLLLGLIKPVGGQVEIFGERVSQFQRWHKVGFVSQKASSFNSGFPATVYEVVSMGLYGKVGLFRFLTKKDKQKVHDAIAQVGMEEYTKQNIGELSGGQQQRVFIARALVSEPELLILDEPTVGVDVASVKTFYELLKNLNEQKGLTLLLITHDTGVMTKYVTEVACLNKTIHFHEPKEFEKNQDMLHVYRNNESTLKQSNRYEEVQV